MIVFRLKASVTPQLIGIESRTRLDMLFYNGVQGFPLAIWNDHCADIAAALFHAHYDYFVLNVVPLSGDSAGLDALVHVARFAADESLIGFHFATIAAQFQKRAVLHGLADSMQHEPSRFLGNADTTVNLVRANPVFAVAQQPHGAQP